MALSDKEISALYFEALGSQHLREQDRKMVTRFAHAVESEVRKSEEALIRQLVDALGECKDSTQERIDTLTESGIDKHKPRYFRSYVQDLQRADDAISAARARLEGKP